MFLSFEFLEAFALIFGRHPRTQDPQDIIITFRVGDHDDTSPDRSDGDETIPSSECSSS